MSKNDIKADKFKQGKPSVATIIFILIVLGAVGTVVSNFAGPYKGWFNRLRQSKQKQELAPLDVKKEQKKDIVETVIEPKEVAKRPEELPKEPEKSEYEKLYDKLFEKYLKKYKEPKVGDKYKFALCNGSIAEGILKSASDGKVVIKDQYGSMTYPINSVSTKSYPKLFPKRAAKIQTLREIERIYEARAKKKEAELSAKAAKEKSKEVAKIVARNKAEKLKKYDPSVIPTPEKTETAT